MSTCIRDGNTYRRHLYKNGTCKGCKQVRPEMKRSEQNRRSRRKVKYAA